MADAILFRGWAEEGVPKFDYDPLSPDDEGETYYTDGLRSTTEAELLLVVEALIREAAATARGETNGA